MRCLPMIGTAQSAWLRIVFVASFLWSGPAFAPDDAIASPGPNSRTGDTRAARPGACSRQSTRCARAVRAAVSAAGVAPCSVATSAKREPATAGSPATSHDATGLDGSPSAERRCAHRAVALHARGLQSRHLTDNYGVFHALAAPAFQRDNDVAKLRDSKPVALSMGQNPASFRGDGNWHSLDAIRRIAASGSNRPRNFRGE